MKIFTPEDIKGQYSPPSNSHKGQNGRLLVIGGSQLFHASIFWSADVASKFVDLVHFSSPANENNNLVRQKIKSGFWNGIVVDWSEIDYYIKEDDCILIGPGMSRVEDPQIPNPKFQIQNSKDLIKAGRDDRTDLITNYLLKKYPHKQWVIDGGALQEVDHKLLNGDMIITPHHKEWVQLQDKSQEPRAKSDEVNLIDYSKTHNNLTILLKGQKDLICQGDKVVKVEGGNAGMTKGGTGDVLAGLVAALYCKNKSWNSVTIASLVNKHAGDSLFKTVGPNFNATDLVNQAPKSLHQLFS